MMANLGLNNLELNIWYADQICHFHVPDQRQTRLRYGNLAFIKKISQKRKIFSF
jgi:hypothetical protein